MQKLWGNGCKANCLQPRMTQVKWCGENSASVVKGMLHSQENVPVSFNSRLVDGKENPKPLNIHSISCSSNSFTVHSELAYICTCLAHIATSFHLECNSLLSHSMLDSLLSWNFVSSAVLVPSPELESKALTAAQIFQQHFTEWAHIPLLNFRLFYQFYSNRLSSFSQNCNTFSFL